MSNSLGLCKKVSNLLLFNSVFEANIKKGLMFLTAN